MTFRAIRNVLSANQQANSMAAVRGRNGLPRGYQQVHTAFSGFGNAFDPGYDKATRITNWQSHERGYPTG